MSAIKFVLAFVKEIEARAKTKETQLLKGHCDSFEAYKSTVEHYQALMSTVALAKELAKDIDDE